MIKYRKIVSISATKTFCFVSLFISCILFCIHILAFLVTILKDDYELFVSIVLYYQ